MLRFQPTTSCITSSTVVLSVVYPPPALLSARPGQVFSHSGHPAVVQRPLCPWGGRLTGWEEVWGRGPSQEGHAPLTWVEHPEEEEGGVCELSPVRLVPHDPTNSLVLVDICTGGQNRCKKHGSSSSLTWPLCGLLGLRSLSFYCIYATEAEIH